MNSSDFIINADVGEGTFGSELDLQLLNEVDAVNIALGGHAGDPAWSRELASRALALGRRVNLHPSYPDKEGFGRRQMNMPWDELAQSLTQQRHVLPQVSSCKFHGALYNQAASDSDLATRLVEWCVAEEISCIITLPDSALALAADDTGLQVMREAFIDRAYCVVDNQLRLAPRSAVNAVIHDVSQAMTQAVGIMEEGQVTCLDGREHPSCDTLCLHGDGESALDIARQLRAWREL